MTRGPGSRGIAGIAGLALVLVACSGVPARTGAPTAPLRTAGATATTTARPSATTAPAATCPAAGFQDASIDLRLLESHETIELQADDGEPAGTPDPGEPFETVDPADAQVVGTVLGGTDIETDLDTGDDDDSLVITALDAEFLPFGSGEALAVETAFADRELSLRFPDRETRGTLRVSVSWTTPCGAGQGSGSMRLAVLPSSVAAGCPPDEQGLENTVVALQGEEVEVGTLGVPLGIVGWSARWLPAVATDEIPRFAGWDQDATQQAAPGASLVLREEVADLRLVSIRVTFYDRAEVVEYLQPDSTNDPTTLDVIRRNAGPQGRAGIPAPLDPGRYVYEIVGVWQTSCLDLDTYAVVGVDVR